MAAEPNQSPFAINRTFETFIVGSPETFQKVKKTVGGLNFIAFPDVANVNLPRDVLFFVIGCIDFTRSDTIQQSAKFFEMVTSPLAIKLLYVSNPAQMQSEQVLFCVEIGARYSFAGPTRDEDMRAWIKKTVIETRESGTIAYFSSEISRFERVRDPQAMSALSDRMGKELPESDASIRLFVQLNTMLGRPRKVEIYLRKALTLNPQCLWAANDLGKLYLRTGRAAEGIEILEKISQFSNLNSERYLELGNAYLNCGQSNKAEGAFVHGDKLTAGNDDRFRDGMLKAAILDGDDQKIKQHMGNKTELSRDTVSFLNTRAIMSMRAGRTDEGMNLYERAIGGVAEKDTLVAAKLMYNKGLGFMKKGSPTEAIKMFESSMKKGGPLFQKAAKTLQVARTIVAKQDKSVGKAAAATVVELDWESLD